MRNLLRFSVSMIVSYIIAGVWVVFIKYYLNIFSLVFTGIPILLIGYTTWRFYTYFVSRKEKTA
jgi:hypothetical protein